MFLRQETSTRLNPQVTSIKKQYVIARSNLKKIIQCEKELTVESKVESDNQIIDNEPNLYLRIYLVKDVYLCIYSLYFVVALS